MTEGDFLAALHANPSDEVTWLALADWLEEDGQAKRAELLRIVRRLLSYSCRTPSGCTTCMAMSASGVRSLIQRASKWCVAAPILKAVSAATARIASRGRGRNPSPGSASARPWSCDRSGRPEP
jgi:uncharacterized protein (TIGR02996 family)